MKKMIDAISGKEKIKVASIDTSLITSNQNTLFNYVGNTLMTGNYNTPIDITAPTLTIDAEEGITIVLGVLTLTNYSTAERPASQNEGSIIYDSTLKKCILYNGTAWVNLDGTALS